MLRFSAALLVGLLLASSAVAETQQQRFAVGFGISERAVIEVAGFLPQGGGDTTHLLLGRYTENGHTQAGVLLMRCDEKQCHQRRVWLEHDSELSLLGLIDLRGKPIVLSELPVVNLRTAKNQFATLPGPTPNRWPVLVLRTKAREKTTASSPHGTATGDQVREHMFMVSLRREDAQFPEILREQIANIYPTGGGTQTSLRLEPGAGNAALSLVGSEVRLLDKWSECLPPKPFPVRYELREGETSVYQNGKPAMARYRRYQRAPNQAPPSIGCY